MRRLLDLRILRWQIKLAYAAGVWLVGYPIAAGLSALELPQSAITLFATSVPTLAGILLGARIFRGKGEPIAPPRPLWQLTARPTLSGRLGIVFAVSAVLSVPAIVRDAIEIQAADGLDNLLTSIQLVVFLGLLAVLYRRSAVQLKRAGVQPLAPEFRSTVKLN